MAEDAWTRFLAAREDFAITAKQIARSVHAHDDPMELAQVHSRLLRCFLTPLDAFLTAGGVDPVPFVIGSILIQRVPAEDLRAADIYVSMRDVVEEVDDVLGALASCGKHPLVVTQREWLRLVVLELAQEDCPRRIHGKLLC
ncbi:MAG TPA: hypothetical protein VGR41_05040, partial [Actinomycetota bacterium]|nr:hypothetical protein [Actinomycetota bacterium]